LVLFFGGRAGTNQRYRSIHNHKVSVEGLQFSVKITPSTASVVFIEENTTLFGWDTLQNTVTFYEPHKNNRE
jgi:hypothetical protein